MAVKSGLGQTTRRMAVLLSTWLLLHAGVVSGEQVAALDATVQHLISYVSDSGLTFIRNSSRHTSAEAADHMHKKYRHFKEDITSPEDFIELCASKSLLTGKPYLVENAGGEKVATSDWLRAELADYRAHQRAAYPLH